MSKKDPAAATRTGRWRALVAVGAAVLTAATFSAGTVGAATSAKGKAAATPSLHSLLTATIKKSGVLVVGSTITFPPMEYYTKGNPTGFDINLAQALASELGIHAKFVNLTFTGLIPALEADRFNIIISGMGDLKSREKVVNFIDYLDVGIGTLVQKGNPDHITSIADLCGYTVAQETGTTGEAISQAQSKKCVAAGKKPITLDLFPKESEVILAVQSGRAVAANLDYPSVVAFAKSVDGGKVLQVASTEQVTTRPYGIAVRKNEPQLEHALHVALDGLIKNGTYSRLLERWGIVANKISKVTINGATT